MTKIMDKSNATAEQMASYLLSVNPSPRINMPAKQFCQLFLDVAAQEGVRGDALFAQACKETGHFKYGGTVTPDQNNYAGLGTTNASTKGAYFTDAATGILALAQHAKGYATKEKLNTGCVDPRYSLLKMYGKLGTAQNWEDLGGKWAVPGYDTKKYASLEEANKAKDSYGYHIIDILNKILKTDAAKNTYTNSSLVDIVMISPNSTNPRSNKIKKITIHHMEGNITVERCGEIFSQKSRYASSNYGIDSNGRVGLYVEECNRSWCSGNRDNDHQAITIEVANDEKGGNWHVSDKALNKLILLCADICKRNNIEKLIYTGDINGNLTMHKWFQATTCPGPYLESKFPYIAAEVNKILGVEEPIKPSVLYKVQTGAFLLKKNAEKRQKELEQKGIASIIKEEGIYNKVQTGAFSIKTKAEAMKKRLADLGYKAIIKEVKNKIY